jgi:ABC-2 type transport system permease protein
MDVELKRWIRKRYSVVVFAIFLLSGLSSPIVADYLPAMMGGLSTRYNMSVSVTKMTWQELFDEYYKNANQLALVVSTYIVGTCCALGRNESLRLFYLTRATRASRIYLPRMAVSVLAVVCAALLGAAGAFYETVIMRSDIDVTRVLEAFVVQIVAMALWVVVAGGLAAWTNSPIVGVGVMVVDWIVEGLLEGADGLANFLPGNALMPSAFLEQGGASLAYKPLIPLAALALLMAISIGLKPLRPTKLGRSTARQQHATPEVNTPERTTR